MTESKTDLTTIVLASIIGGLILYLILKSTGKLNTATAQLQLNQPINNASQPIIDLTQSQQIQQPVQILENDENWEFKKDDKGRIVGVNVHRKLFDMSNLKV